MNWAKTNSAFAIAAAGAAAGTRAVVYRKMREFESAYRDCEQALGLIGGTHTFLEGKLRSALAADLVLQ